MQMFSNSDRNSIQQYTVLKALSKPNISSGKLDGPWECADWTLPFIDIRGTDFPQPRFETRVKMMYDDDNFYVGALMEESHIWTNITEKNSVIYWQNDFEVFVDPGTFSLIIR